MEQKKSMEKVVSHCQELAVSRTCCGDNVLYNLDLDIRVEVAFGGQYNTNPTGPRNIWTKSYKNDERKKEFFRNIHRSHTDVVAVLVTHYRNNFNARGVHNQDVEDTVGPSFVYFSSTSGDSYTFAHEYGHVLGYEGYYTSSHSGKSSWVRGHYMGNDRHNLMIGGEKGYSRIPPVKPDCQYCRRLAKSTKGIK